MIINPKIILDEGVVIPFSKEYIIDETKQCQQHGIDLRIHSVAEIINISKKNKVVRISEKVKDPPVIKQIESVEGYVTLKKGRAYIVDFCEYINLPKNYGAILFVRSTFNRCGVYTTNGYWDPGFHGRLGTTIHTDIDLEIEIGMRLCQVIVMEGESYNMYKGQYQGGKLTIK